MSQARHHPPTGSARDAASPPSSSPRGRAAKDTTDDYALCQEYNGYTVQLRGLLEETTGTPPSGVNTAEVEHRIALIQSALDEVQRRGAETRWRMELRQNQRFLDTYTRRINAEAEAEQKRQYADKQRRAQVEEMRSIQVAYYKDRNDRTDAKALQCRSHNVQAQVEAVERAGSNEERRTRNLANLASERQRKQRELHDREQAKQEYARQVRDRRAAQSAQEREEKARLAQIHSQEMEDKLAAAREAKRSTWAAKRATSRARSQVVFENGEAVLETIQMDHSRLVEEMHQRHRQQAERYSEGKTEQEAYLRQRAQLRVTRQERQQDTLRRLVDQRVSRGDAIVKGADKKREKAQRAKERQAAHYSEAARELDEDIPRHKLRAEQLQEEQYNAALRQNYRRWNHRAARIIQELQAALQEEDAVNAAQRSNAAHREWAGVDATRRDPPAAVVYAARPLTLPSPEDFAV